MHLFYPLKHKIVDAFCNAINKSIKKRERDFYKNKNKQTKADEEQENELEDETEETFTLFNVTYKNILAMVVCNVRKMECMVYWCHKWPTYTALKEYVESSCDDIGGKNTMKFADL